MTSSSLGLTSEPSAVTLNRRRFIGLAVAGAGAVLAAACAPAATQAPRQGTSSGGASPSGKLAGSAASIAPFNVTLSMDVASQNADPFSITAVSTQAVTFSPAFDTLTRFDASSGKVGPSLATAWRNTDPKTWEFTLREGVKFSGGQDFTASVVKVNVDRLLGPTGQASSFAAFQAPIAGAEVVSPTVVRIITKQPDPVLPQRVSLLWMVGPDYPAEVGAPPYNSKTNGTGPFQITQFRPAEGYDYTYHSNAWRLQGKPNLVRGLKVVRIAEATARVAALRSREVDVIFSLTTPEALMAVNSPDIRLIRAKAVTGQSVRFDLLHSPADHPIRNKLVRQALEHAIDRDALNKAAYGGLYTPLGQAAAPGVFGYDPGFKTRSFDLNRAKELMAQAGYPNGFQLTLWLIASQDAEALAVAGMWQKIGVETKISAMDVATFAQAANAGKLWPVYATAIAWPFFDADSGLSLFSNTIPEGRQIFGNQQFNEAYARSLSELDPPKRETLLRQAIAILHEETVVIVLGLREYVYGVNAALSWAPRSDAIIDYETFTKTA